MIRSILQVALIATALWIGATWRDQDPVVAAHEHAVTDSANVQAHEHAPVPPDLSALRREIATALDDVACLYRGYLAKTLDGYGRDEPVPGAWQGGRQSPLWVGKLTAADCAQRFVE